MIKVNAILSIIFGAFAPYITGISSGFFVIPLHYYFSDFVVAALTIFVLAESVRLFAIYLQKRMPWLQNLKMKISLQLIFALLVSSLTIGLAHYLYVVIYYDQSFFLGNFIYFFISGFLLSLIFSSFWNAYFFFNEIKEQKIKLERAKTEKISAQLENLKANISPHFLFNSLNILKGLIDQDSRTSKIFIDKFSEIFRYNLDRSEKELSMLKEEIRFAQAYVHIIKMRFNDGIEEKIDIPDAILNSTYIPWSSLQMLIENCVKHNVANNNNPLQIKIHVESDYLCVENNIVHKYAHQNSTGYGLGNLKKRYALFTNRPIVIMSDNYYYKVRLPLLKIEEYAHSNN